MQTTGKKITVGILGTFIPTLLAFTPLTASAQNTESKVISDYDRGILIFTTPEGRDSVVRDVYLYSKFNSQEAQQKIVRLNDDLSTTTYLPDQIKVYYIGKTRYQSVSIKKENGSVGRIFVKRDKRSFYQDCSAPSLFEVYNSPNKYSLYVRTKENEPIVPFNEEGDNVITQYYVNENKNSGGNENIEKWLTSKPAHKRNKLFVEKVIAAQNYNYIPALRFGAGVGIACNSIKVTDFTDTELDAASQLQATANLFADYHCSWGLGMHVDLTFNKFSFENFMPTNQNGRTFHMVYNRTTLNVPVMVRYTYTKLTGKLLPFIQAGVQGDFFLKDECLDYRVSRQKGIVKDDTGYSFDKYDSGKSTFSIVAGAGVEYRLTANHSVFFDIKYAAPTGPNHKHEDDKYTMKCSSIMFNLSANL